MIDGQPLVTVFMAVYNGEKYIKEAIESILGQTFADFELLIVNDGSTDGSMAVIADIKDSRIRVLHNERNMGIFLTRNKGIAEARGKYFATLDCDDVALVDRLEKQVDFMRRYPDCAVCGSMAFMIDGASQVTGRFEPPAGMEELPSYLFFANCFINSTTLIRADVLKSLRYRNGFEPAEDYDLFCRLAESHPVANIGYPLVRYRVHGGNVTESKAAQKMKGEKTVIAYNLRRIGLDATEDQVALHHLFISKKFREAGVTLEQVERHLSVLKSANGTKGLYPPRLFDKVLMWQWTIAAGYFGVKGKNGIIYFRSGLFRVRFLSKRYLGIWRRG